MAVSTNEFTGDKLKSKLPTEDYRNGYNTIFGLSTLEKKLYRELWDDMLITTVHQIPQDIRNEEGFKEWYTNFKLGEK